MTQATNEKQSKPNAEKISAEIVSMAAAKAALNVPGVSMLCNTLAGNLTRMLGGSDYDDIGIKVSKGKEGLEIDVFVFADFGVYIPQLAWDIQKSEKEAVEEVAPDNVAKVNIQVQGVYDPQEGNE